MMATNHQIDAEILAERNSYLREIKGDLQGNERLLNDLRSKHQERKNPQAPEAKLGKAFSRVLIVEPSLATLQLCIRVLKEFGSINVASVQDGYEALGQLLKEEFDGVITSLHVPTIDGQSLFAVLRTISGPNMATPVILLT